MARESHTRLAGTGRLPGGRRVTWTVAGGRRGRRWRSVTTGADGRLVQAVLMEVSPEGRLERLEVASPAGLLTLHPEPDASTLHGNVVRATGVEHVALPWSAAHILLVGGSPLAGAVAAAWVAGRVGVGEGMSVPAVEIGDDLSVRRATWRVARLATARWCLLAADRGAVITIDLDQDGLPAGLEDAESWPLELPAGA